MFLELMMPKSKLHLAQAKHLRFIHLLTQTMQMVLQQIQKLSQFKVLRLSRVKKIPSLSKRQLLIMTLMKTVLLVTQPRRLLLLQLVTSLLNMIIWVKLSMRLMQTVLLHLLNCRTRKANSLKQNLVRMNYQVLVKQTVYLLQSIKTVRIICCQSMK